MKIYLFFVKKIGKFQIKMSFLFSKMFFFQSKNNNYFTKYVYFNNT